MHSFLLHQAAMLALCLLAGVGAICGLYVPAIARMRRAGDRGRAHGYTALLAVLAAGLILSTCLATMPLWHLAH